MRSLAFLFAFVAAASAIPSPGFLTNAQRLARNLPPLPPRFVNILPGRSPTPAYVAKRSKPSSTPVTHTGRLALFKGETLIGYVENKNVISGSFTVSAHGDLEVSLTPTSTEIFDMLAVNAQWTGSKFLGAASFGGPEALKEGHAGPDDIRPFASVSQTPPDSPPLDAGRVEPDVNKEVFGESAIWEINSQNELTVDYVNPDGKHVHPLVVYDPTDKTFGFASDASGPKEVVKLILVS